MRVIVDNKIPFIKEAIEKIADSVIYTPGRDFTPELVKDADALIIRTRTRCNNDPDFTSLSESVTRYFDYEAYGQYLDDNGRFVETDHGIYELP